MEAAATAATQITMEKKQRLDNLAAYGGSARPVRRVNQFPNRSSSQKRLSPIRNINTSPSGGESILPANIRAGQSTINLDLKQQRRGGSNVRANKKAINVQKFNEDEEDDMLKLIEETS